jgi:RNA polymerase primary sigma factor
MLGTRPASLDAPISSDSATEFGESVADEETRTPFEALRDKDLRNKVESLLQELDDREKRIISQRFGFGGGERKTLQHIGDKLGVSRERIRQLENVALEKLRHALSKKEGPVGLPIAA